MTTNEKRPPVVEHRRTQKDQLDGGSETTVPRRVPARHLLANNPYGLTLPEVRAEIRRCCARGWQLWEIRRRFAPDREAS
ncbi:hypothetical protein FNQ90_07140 [Streptomyces alkaliphilus]|uniref:Uncharacterized protein n=1 Tax=Streptomyces alkaliphilus TaxID=1472722 RepID=A0A7W3TBN2_9ACTN|nr:hypothetical protein [Streptomyces alkaliphilus]MBB0243886.1 hypothetical protein [Streptomyces alkaliphilus]